jgi:GNAT superfamily N-acetyltransferase
MSNHPPAGENSVFTRKISFQPLSEKNWNHFEKLFGHNGACGGCWCMYWRLHRKEYEVSKGEGNKTQMRQLIRGEVAPGVLMFLGKEAIGWSAVAPRESFPVLENSRVLKRVDARAVWSVVCFFIAKEYRRHGFTQPFLEYLIHYCRNKGASIIEAYPLEVPSKNYPVVFAHIGFSSIFKKAGFKEVERRSPTRPIMRYFL